MDPENIHTIQDSEHLSNLNNLHTFQDFTNFYDHFIHNDSHILQPLSFLTQKGTPLAWKEDQEEAFDTLTNTFIVAPVLAGFDRD
jgi:hypothetical protein